MTIPVQIVLVIAGLIASARTHITLASTTLGVHATIPVLGLIAAATVLALAAGLLLLCRVITRDGGLWLATRTAA